MLKDHDLGVILAPTSHLINLIFCTNFKILHPQMPKLINYIKFVCKTFFEIMRMEIPMSRFGYILAAIDNMPFSFPSNQNKKMKLIQNIVYVFYDGIS